MPRLKESRYKSYLHSEMLRGFRFGLVFIFYQMFYRFPSLFPTMLLNSICSSPLETVDFLTSAFSVEGFSLLREEIYRTPQQKILKCCFWKNVLDHHFSIIAQNIRPCSSMFCHVLLPPPRYGSIMYFSQNLNSLNLRWVHYLFVIFFISQS